MFLLLLLNSKERLKYCTYSLCFMRHKNKKNYGSIALSLFIATIMVTSIIGYIFADNQDQAVKYNGIKFTLISTGWKANIDGKNYLFSYDPKSVEDMELPDDVFFDNVMEIDATYDPNSTYKEAIAQSIFEFANILSVNNIYLRPGFTSNTSFGVSIITCDDASPFVPVLYYKSSNQTIVTSQDNCLIIEARDANSFLALTDRIAYKILGVIE